MRAVVWAAAEIGEESSTGIVVLGESVTGLCPEGLRREVVASLFRRTCPFPVTVTMRSHQQNVANIVTVRKGTYYSTVNTNRKNLTNRRRTFRWVSNNKLRCSTLLWCPPPVAHVLLYGPLNVVFTLVDGIMLW